MRTQPHVFDAVMPAWFVNTCYGLTFLYVAVAVGSQFIAVVQALPERVLQFNLRHSPIFRAAYGQTST